VNEQGTKRGDHKPGALSTTAKLNNFTGEQLVYSAARR
jgi:hypothetical protein